MATVQIVNDSKTKDRIVNSHSIIASMSFFTQWTSEINTEESKIDIMHKKEAAILSLIKNIIEYSETCKNNKTSYSDIEIANIFLIVSKKWIDCVLPKMVELDMAMVPDFSKIDYEHPLHIAMAHYCYSQGVLYSNRNSKVTCEVHIAFQEKYNKNITGNRLEHQEIAEMYSEFSYVKLLNLCFQRLLKDSLYGHDYSEKSDVYENAKELLDLSVINYNKVINNEVSNLVEEIDNDDEKSPVNSTGLKWGNDITNSAVESNSINNSIDIVIENNNDEENSLQENVETFEEKYNSKNKTSVLHILENSDIKKNEAIDMIDCKHDIIETGEQNDYEIVRSSERVADCASHELSCIKDIHEITKQINHEKNGQNNNSPDGKIEYQIDNQTTEQQDCEHANPIDDDKIEPDNKDDNDERFELDCDEISTITNYSHDDNVVRDSNVLQILSYKSAVGIFIMEMISFIKNDSTYSCDNMKTNLRHLLELIKTDDVVVKEACRVIDTGKITSLVRKFIEKSETPEKYAEMMCLIDEIDAVMINNN